MVNGKVISIDHNHALIDVGLKSEGRISIDELRFCDKEKEIKVGDNIDVFVERIEDKNGEAVLSREKAKKESAFNSFDEILKKDKPVDGSIYGKVKGGYTVDVDGVITFLPGSQVDVKPVKDISHLVGQKLSFKVLKIDKERGNIVISRKAFLEESLKENIKESKKNFKEGKEVEGIVKNITDYGAFIDLGIADGLLHLTDISWKRINHPSDYLKIGEKIKVKILDINVEKERISLGIKQLSGDPIENYIQKNPIKSKTSGKITEISDKGLSIELEDNIKGFIKKTNLSKDKTEQKVDRFAMDEKVDSVIMSVDSKSRIINLSIKEIEIEDEKKALSKYGSKDSGASLGDILGSVLKTKKSD